LASSFRDASTGIIEFILTQGTPRQWFHPSLTVFQDGVARRPNPKKVTAMTGRLCFGIFLCAALTGVAHATDLPTFKDDLAADAWLRRTSVTYRKMAETMDARGGYRIANTTLYPRSMMICEEKKPVVLLNEKQTGALRVTLMIFEFSNASQADKFREIAGGGTTTAEEYAILHMLVEYESLHLHEAVLADLDKALGAVPPEMFQVFMPATKTFAEYRLPEAYEYIQLRKGTEYRKYYEDWFHEHVEKKVGK
jgi:hypothetical protein